VLGPIAALLLAASPPAPPLADAAALIRDARLDVRYATADNLAGRPLYPAARCLLLPAVAARLQRAAAALGTSGYRIVLHDCYRPLSVQRALWAAAPRPGYVADPRTGSNHNRAAAVDLSLERADGTPVPLPTGYDAFTPAARARAGAAEGVSQEAQRHRDALRAAMLGAGFTPHPAEWWHFDAPEARGAPLLDLPIVPAAEGAR